MQWQPVLSPRYTSMTDDELVRAIAARKAELGDKLIILGHHYQQDDVIQFADFTGDSFKLSQLAAEQVEKAGARYVIFAGVHFMAESADILTPDDVAVILPDLSAGCSMADMADIDEVIDAWDQLHEVLPTGDSAGDGPTYRVIPICYMNSTAAVKSFCGEHGGAVCTSSNCHAVFEWALAGGTQPLAPGERIKILFLPDQHLGRNTAAAVGFDPDADMAVWDPRHADGLGGLDPETIEQSTFLLWKGHCSVHMLFRPEHVDQIRAQWPDVTVMVHPECAHDVVVKADRTGSTQAIISAVEAAKPGSRWAIGTEVHLVNRLSQSAAKRGVTARILSDCQCLCTTMYRIDLPHLLWALDELVDGRVVNQISVHPHVKHWATVALDRMLSITAASKSAKPAAAQAESAAPASEASDAVALAR